MSCEDNKLPVPIGDNWQLPSHSFLSFPDTRTSLASKSSMQKKMSLKMILKFKINRKIDIKLTELSSNGEIFKKRTNPYISSSRIPSGKMTHFIVDLIRHTDTDWAEVEFLISSAWSRMIRWKWIRSSTDFDISSVCVCSKYDTTGAFLSVPINPISVRTV